MKTLLRLTLALGLMLMLPLSIAAQSHTMTVDGTIVEDATDLDAQTYYPKWDVNDELCALLKVTIIGTLPEPLMLDVRGVGVTDRVERSNGEIWFYLPHHAKNLLFSCKGLEPLEPIAVRLREGRVYKMRIRANSHSQVVTNATPTSNYLKMILSEAGATVSLGKTPEYELVGRIVEGKLFSMRLNHGTYYYRVEHPLCQTATGVVTVGAESNEVAITLQPAWGQLSIDSTPSGATLYINGRRIGTTPCSPEEKFAQGTVEVRLLHNDYHPLTRTLTIAGNGERHSYTFELSPQFGTATVSCPDGEAEIWIDNEYKGKGRWTGTLNSLSSHLVESRRAGHIGQSVELEVTDGQRTSIEVGGPVAMYGTLDLAVEPELASVEIDGKAVGTAPLMVQLTATTHKVRLTAEGYHPDEFEVTIGHNKSSRMFRRMSQVKHIEKKEEPAFVKVEVMPSFMGGDLNTFRTWFSGEFKIPAIAAEYGIQGKVVMKFVIEKDGSVGGIEFLQSPDKVYEDEARRVLMKSPKWTPGRQRGQVVRVFYILPIDCRLQ